jgi:hypothetical protein
MVVGVLMVVLGVCCIGVYLYEGVREYWEMRDCN